MVDFHSTFKGLKSEQKHLFLQVITKEKLIANEHLFAKSQRFIQLSRKQ